MPPKRKKRKIDVISCDQIYHEIFLQIELNIYDAQYISRKINTENFPIDYLGGDKKLWTLLHVACYHGRDDLFDLFIEKGANVSYLAEGGNSCLHLISETGRGYLAEKIISEAKKSFSRDVNNDGKVFVNHKNDAGWTALQLAVNYKNLDMVHFLLKNGANINDKMAHNGVDFNLMQMACGQGSSIIARYLSEAEGGKKFFSSKNIEIEHVRESNLYYPFMKFVLAKTHEEEIKFHEVIGFLQSKGEIVSEAFVENVRKLHPEYVNQINSSIDSQTDSKAPEVSPKREEIKDHQKLVGTSSKQVDRAQ